MSTKSEVGIRICDSLQISERGKLLFAINFKGKRCDAILLRFGGSVYGYLNQCVHMPFRLDCEEQNIFNDTGEYLQCTMHGVCYDPTNGIAISELCKGKKLTALKVKEFEDAVYLVDKRAVGDIVLHSM